MGHILWHELVMTRVIIPLEPKWDTPLASILHVCGAAASITRAVQLTMSLSGTAPGLRREKDWQGGEACRWNGPPARTRSLWPKATGSVVPSRMQTWRVVGWFSE